VGLYVLDTLPKSISITKQIITTVCTCKASNSHWKSPWDLNTLKCLLLIQGASLCYQMVIKPYKLGGQLTLVTTLKGAQVEAAEGVLVTETNNVSVVIDDVIVRSCGLVEHCFE